jgi:hypothetical protein
VRGLRIVWDLFVYLTAFGCIHSYALNRFATTDDQSFYFAQAVRDMLINVSRSLLYSRLSLSLLLRAPTLPTLSPPLSQKTCPIFLSQEPFETPPISFLDVSNEGEFWSFIKGPLLESLFPVPTTSKSKDGNKLRTIIPLTLF